MIEKLNLAIDRVNTKILLILLVGIQILFMFYYCNMKQGYFVDEIWSYGLANSYYHTYIWDDNDLEQPEIDSELFEDYLTVNEGEEFTYGSVFYNQARDVHPPLFYAVLHTISSFFPGEFSKWFGLIPNIFYYAFTIIGLYKIASLFSKNRYFAFLTIAFYGFSMAAVDTVIYIRMYMLLTMWSVWFAYFHLLVLKQQKIRKRDLALLAFTVCGGVFTQYMFAAFAFPWVVMLLAFLIMKKNWKSIAGYIGAGIAGGIPFLVLFPAGITKILGISSGGGGGSGSGNILDQWKNNIDIYYKMLEKNIFGGALSIIIFVLILSVILYFITQILFEVKMIKTEEGHAFDVKRRTDTTPHRFNLDIRVVMTVCIFIATVFYYLIVAKLSPYISNRYLMSIYPFAAMLFCVFIYGTIKLWKVYGYKRNMAMLLCVLFVGALTYYVADPEYTYPEKAAGIEMSEKYEDLPCVYVYTTAYLLINNALELENFDEIYQTYYFNIDKVIPMIKDSEDGMILYIDRIMKDTNIDGVMTASECVEEVEELAGLNKSDQVYQDDKVVVYHLYNEKNRKEE